MVSSKNEKEDEVFKGNKNILNDGVYQVNHIKGIRIVFSFINYKGLVKVIVDFCKVFKKDL